MNENSFLIDPDVEQYCEAHTSAESQTLQQLARETNLKMVMPQMLSSKIQGRLLTMLVELIKPKNILELGTFTGYSAICMAQGLPDDGRLVTIDNNPEVETLARKYFKMSGLESKIHFINGDAMHIVPELNICFDMAFIDADKERLPDYYPLVMEKMNTGGVIVVDNILWYGKAADPKQNDRTTLKIRQFNELVQRDTHVTNILLPLCDGLMVVRKK
ncbi:MAG: O-methyltransferase [Bacteroidales bacterium]|nr:O-methyltransferase [Bacteroidales bacterium]